MIFVLLACDQKLDTGTADDTAASGDTGSTTGEPGYTVTVSGGGETAEVDLSRLTVGQIGGEDVVLLQDVVTASGIDADWAGTTFDFEASDGFRPSDRDCDPVDWSQMAMGGIYPLSGNLTWDDSLGFYGCYFVDGVILIEAQD